VTGGTFERPSYRGPYLYHPTMTPWSTLSTVRNVAPVSCYVRKYKSTY
jgi:putative alpha-1,2-mannosidase